MAKRKGWSDLSTGYRRRLERDGITRSKYERGTDLGKARGHGRTPEHPLPPGKPVPKRYERWYNKRYNQPIKMLSSDGEVFLVSVSRTARSRIGSHWNAVHSALWNIDMPKAWWWTPNHEDRLRRFAKFRIRGRRFEPGQPLGDPESFQFMTSFDDVADWTYEDTSSFNNIYEMVA